MHEIDKIIRENGLKVKENITIKDNRGNITYEYWYDSNHNLIHFKNSDGPEWQRDYDSNNNEIHFKNSKVEYWIEYDSNNVLTRKLELKEGVYYLNGEKLK